MEEYQAQLKAQMQNFIYQCVKVTGQWIPSFWWHWLCLFNSNFLEINIFLHNPVIRKSLGYDFYATNPLSPNDYPFTKKDKVIEEEQLPVPQQLIDHCSSQNIKQVRQVQITKHEILEKGCFVSIQSHGSRRHIGSVQWEYHSRSRSKFYIHFSEFKIHEFNELYSMREVSCTQTKQYVNVNEIEACINVQHNCDKGKCPIKKTKPSLNECQETEIMTAQVEHLDKKHFVINTASFHDPFQHHIISQTNLPQLFDADMVQCAVEGLGNWGRNHFVFENPYAAADDNNNDGEEEDNTDNIN
ncbi:hypothetical protein KEM48_012757 [Puccinia striiformis f. sp. tritici PST-130]|nr:hypothetical protein KEM48_012757 [Puccinia striiformis f. sp. tritici PST-130]